MADSAQSLFQNVIFGENITKGDTLYTSGINTVMKAKADSNTTMFVDGIAQEDGLAGQWRSMLVTGVFENFTHGFAGNVDLFQSALTAGAMASAEPAAPDLSQKLAKTLDTESFIFRPIPFDVNLEIKAPRIIKFAITGAGSGLPFFEINSGTYTRAANLSWKGSSFWGNPNRIVFMAFNSQIGQTFDLRVLDVDNGLVIAEAIGLSAGVTSEIKDLGALSNISNSQVRWSIEGRKNSGGKCRISEFSMEL